MVFRSPNLRCKAPAKLGPCNGILEFEPKYRSKNNHTYRCKRCKRMSGVPTTLLGKCLFYEKTHGLTIIEEDGAGLIGPKCQGCVHYKPETMSPLLHVVNVKRCPFLDQKYIPDKQTFERFFSSFRDVDPEEGRKDGLKRLSDLIRSPPRWPTS